MKAFFQLYIITLLLFTCQCSHGQFSFHKDTIFSNSKKHYFGFAFGELNSDGKKDLILHEGGYSGHIISYVSENLDNSWHADTIAKTGPRGKGFSAGSLSIGDIDNDGDIDVLACEHAGEWSNNYSGDTTSTNIYWLENQKDTSHWKPHHIGTIPDYVKDMKLARINDDKLPDLVTITYNDAHNLSVFVQKADNGWERKLNIMLDNLHEGMDVGDIDGNGTTDIATNGYWIKNAEDTFEVHVIDKKWHNQTGDWRKNATKTICGDIDRDGKKEVFIAHSERSGYPVAWYDLTDVENNTWEEHIIYEGLSAVHTLQTGDIDRDGDMDVLAGENGDHNAPGDDDNRQVFIFLNEGDNQSWKKHPFSETGLYNGLLVDVNSDGKPDIAGPHGHKTETFTVWYTFPEY